MSVPPDAPASTGNGNFDQHVLANGLQLLGQ